jgi:two-component system response regulator (stage 0 sporulation protein A)
MITLEEKVDMLLALAVADTEKERISLKHKVQEVLKHNHIDPNDAMRPDIKRRAETLLLKMGVPCSIKGFGELTTAVCMVVKDPELLREVTIQLYPLVARAHEDDPRNAERSIRHAVEVAWNRGDADTHDKYFINSVSRKRGKPTNAEFIATLAMHISRGTD